MNLKRAAIWLAVVSAWGYGELAVASCTASISGAIDQNVSSGTCVYAPTASPAAALTVDGTAGPSIVTAAGGNTYLDTFIGLPGVAPYGAFIRVAPTTLSIQDAQLTLSGSQALFVSPTTSADGMDVFATGVSHNANVTLAAANLVLNIGSNGKDGIQIASDGASSAVVTLTNSSVDIETGGSYGIKMQGALSALTGTGTQNALTIGTVFAPSAAALSVTLGATVNLTSLVDFNSSKRGVELFSGSVFHLDGVDASQSTITVTGGSPYALGLDYESSDTTGELKNVTVNMSGPTQDGFNINVTQGALDLQNVQLKSNMIDSSTLTVSGGAVTGSGLAVDVSGKGTGGIDVEPNANGQITLNGTVAGNTIITRGDADYTPTYTDLPYSNAAGIRLLGGSIGMASTDVETYGNGAPGLYLGKGTISSGTGVTIHTHGDGADGIVYTPFAGNTGNLTTAFSPTTSVQTDGSNAYGFVVDGYDLYDNTGTPHPFTLPFSSTGLSPAAITVQGVGAAAIGARNDATLILDGQSLSALAGLPSGTYAVEAESGGTVQFTTGTTTGGASLLAGAGGTLNFNDNSASASGSLVAISQGSSATSRGELDLSGRTQALAVGQLASVGSGSTNGLVNLGANTLQINGNSTTPAVFSGTIQGTGGLSKYGQGEQILSGQDAFDYTGATQINAGTLAAAGGAIGRDANGSFKLFQIGGSSALDIGNNQGSFEAGAISGLGTVHLTDSGTSASSNLILEGTGAPQTFTGMIDGSGGVTLRGNASQTFEGPQVFDFSGDVTLGGGSLTVSGNAQAAGNRFVFDDGANTGGTLNIGANGVAGFSVAGIEATHAATTAQIQLGASSGSAVNLVLAGSSNYSFDGTIAGYGNVVKQGTGTQTMSGVNPFGFNGTTVIDSGVLQLRNIANPSQFNESFVLNGGWLDLSDSTFDTAGQNANDWAQLHVTDGARAANGGIIGGDDKVTLGANSSDSSEAAQIDGGVFVVKTGSNTVTLTGTNTYVGNTRILDGTLKVSHDANLGNTTYEREIVLGGGNLEIGGSGNFSSSRQLQLQAAGAVQVDGDSSVSATLGNLAGSGQTFTKTGGGGLTFTSGGSVGQIVATDGALDLRSTHVDATTLAVAGQAAITQAAGTTVSLVGGAVTSRGDAIVANGTSTLNLGGNTQVTAGGATYRVTSGTGTLNASGETLANNVLEADGAGSKLAVNLSNNSGYTGTPTLTGGAQATLSIDGSSSWNMTSNTELAELTNLGTVTLGAAGATVAVAVAVAKSAAGPGYRTLTVNGGYQGGGTLIMRTQLNVGGALSNQHTDRMIVAGSASGQTSLNLTASGAGANTNTANNDQVIPTEGISLVQVEGASTANAFTLKGGYVAAQGSPYQYRLFAYGPGSNTLPAASQSLLPDGTTPQWDYRLQTSYVDDSGHVQPGPGPQQCCARPSIVPQGTSELSVPLALQNYESVVTDGLYRRLGNVRHGAFDSAGPVDDVFARTIDSRSMYHSNRGFNEYGFDFGQYITAVQFGGDWLHRRQTNEDFRLGAAVTLGHSSVFPQAAAVESSNASIDAYNLALTGTWQRRNGWYVDGVLSAGWYRGTVDTSQHGEAGRISADGFDGSLEAGRSFVLSHGIEIEPHARMLAQLLHFQGRKDNDGIDASTGDLLALTGLLGVQVSMAVPNTVSFRPYMRVDFAYTQTNLPDVTLSGHPFAVGRPGGAMELGMGATGSVTPNFSIYGELSGRQRLGPGISTLAATLGLRYAF